MRLQKTKKNLFHPIVQYAVMNDVFFKTLTGIDVPKLNMIPIIRYI